MTILALVLAVVAFVVVLEATQAVAFAQEAAAVARAAAGAIGAPDLHDDEKERRVRAAALTLFRIGAVLTLVTTAALGAATLVIWLGQLFGFYRIADAIALASDWRFIAVSSIGAILVWMAIRGRLQRHRDVQT